MTIAPPVQFIQPTMFELMPDRKIELVGQQRAVAGIVCEEIVTTMLDLIPIVKGGTYDCVFDAWREDTYFEIKSLRKNQKCSLYVARLAKDKKANVPLRYVFAIHDVTGAKSEEDWRIGFGETMKKLLVIDAHLVRQIARRFKLNKIKQKTTASGDRNGYQREGYCEGYRNVAQTALIEACTSRVGVAEACVCGVDYEAEIFIN